MYWINGQQQNEIAVSDRGLQFGDGGFTTARIEAGQIQLLPMHIQRLQQASARLLLPELDWPLLTAEMQQAAASTVQGVLKVILTRGSGGRGYSGQGCSQATRIITVSAYPTHYSDWQQQGIRLALSPVMLGRNPLLAGLKHLNRLEQVLIRQHLDNTDAQEALVLDTAGLLVECCAANLFWRKGQQVFTPSVNQAGVDGIMRRHILALLAESPYQAQVVEQPLIALADADEVLVSNALMPILPVNQAEQWQYSSRQLYHFLHSHC